MATATQHQRAQSERRLEAYGVTATGDDHEHRAPGRATVMSSL